MIQVKMKAAKLILDTLCIMCVMGDQEDQEARLSAVENSINEFKLTQKQQANEVNDLKVRFESFLDYRGNIYNKVDAFFKKLQGKVADLKIQNLTLTNLELQEMIRDQDRKIEEQDKEIKLFQQAEADVQALKRWLFWPNFDYVFSIDNKVYLYSGSRQSYGMAQRLCKQFRSKAFEPRNATHFKEVKTKLSELGVPSDSDW